LPPCKQRLAAAMWDTDQGWAMLLAKGDLELVAMSLTVTWPLGSHVNKGDREGSHGAHLNLQTVMTTCVVTVWTSWHVH